MVPDVGCLAMRSTAPAQGYGLQCLPAPTHSPLLATVLHAAPASAVMLDCSPGEATADSG